MHRVHLVLEHRTLRLNQTYTYLAEETCQAGMRVLVEFGHQELTGFVIKTEEHDAYGETEFDLKPILKQIDFEPILNTELLELGQWMAHETLAPVVSCYQAMLPKLSTIKTLKQSVKTERFVVRTALTIDLNERHQAIVDAVSLKQAYSPLKKRYGSAVDTLIRKGVLACVIEEAQYRPHHPEKSSQAPKLSKDQHNALDHIRNSTKPVCLLGATGSGKTELYLALAQEALANQKQALILVPEIGLTPQMVDRVQKRFGQDVIVYHSHLNANERYQQYQRVKTGEQTVVVGTRSAIFLPFQHLDLIVIDEEHDNSYKQESHPRYHTKDIALRRAQTHHAKVVLGSATPSFETYARALKEVYTLVTLKQRVVGELPIIHTITPSKFQRTILAKETQTAIQTRLDAHQQVIILLNRRGYAPILQCLECGEAVQCPSCDRLLHVHSVDAKLKCHACGYQSSILKQCPHCHSTHLRMLGVGTQRLEEELKSLFPSAKVARLDKDTTQTKHAHRRILEDFSQGHSDILIGTQMIAKGLDIPNVTLSVILEIDQSLLRPDYRSIEEAFDLVVQTAGRSGRSDHKGEVIVQTRLPKHYAIQWAQKHDYVSFFNQEMKYRHAGQNPPYTYLITVTLISLKPQSAMNPLYQLTQYATDTIKILGPSDLGKLQNRYRARCILKGKDVEEMRLHLERVLPECALTSDVDWVIDVNPRSLF